MGQSDNFIRVHVDCRASKIICRSIRLKEKKRIFFGENEHVSLRRSPDWEWPDLELYYPLGTYGWLHCNDNFNCGLLWCSTFTICWLLDSILSIRFHYSRSIRSLRSWKWRSSRSSISSKYIYLCLTSVKRELEKAFYNFCVCGDCGDLSRSATGSGTTSLSIIFSRNVTLLCNTSLDLDVRMRCFFVFCFLCYLWFT